jgi:sarcosine oxidase subunit beta
MTRTADVVVIGGGINGCSAAYHLAKRGAGKVLLLEQRHIAGGPTGRSSGIVRQHYTLETLACMARDSLQVFRRFADEVGGSAGFVQTGAVFLASSENAATLEQTVAMHQRLGIRTSVLSAEELGKMEELLYREDVACAAYEPDSGYADPALAANSYCEAAKSLGVDVMVHTTVTGLQIEKGRVRGVQTDKGGCASPAVVNVAGPWGAEIAALAGARIPIVPSRHPVVLMQRPPQWRNPTPVWLDLINGAYFKPEGRAGMLIGSIRPEEGELRADPETFSQTPSYEEVAGFSDTIMKRFPVMNEGLVQGGWAGIYDVTPDWQPVIDAIPDAQGFYCAVGFSGHGFKLAPAVGRILAELVLEGSCRSYDIGMFRYERFQAGSLSPGKYHYSIIG